MLHKINVHKTRSQLQLSRAGELHLLGMVSLHLRGHVGEQFLHCKRITRVRKDKLKRKLLLPSRPTRILLFVENESLGWGSLFGVTYSASRYQGHPQCEPSCQARPLRTHGSQFRRQFQKQSEGASLELIKIKSEPAHGHVALITYPQPQWCPL